MCQEPLRTRLLERQSRSAATPLDRIAALQSLVRLREAARQAELVRQPAR